MFFESSVALLDWLGLIAFTISGALVASRKQMDLVGFALLGTVTGIGGGTVRDILLDIHPILWIEYPEYLAICIATSLVVFSTAHLVHSRLRWLLWADAIGLALFATVGTERAIASGAPPLVAVMMGIITACVGGMIRDILSQEDSIIFSREIYVTSALAAALSFVCLHAIETPREIAISISVVAGFSLRSGALIWGWSLPRYRPRPPRL